MGLDFYHTYFDLLSFPLQLDWNIMDNDKKNEKPPCVPPSAYILASACFFCACLYTPLRRSFLQHIQTCNLNGIRLSQTYDSEPFSSLKTILWIKSLVMVATHGKAHDFPTSLPRGFSYFVFNAPLEQT